MKYFFHIVLFTLSLNSTSVIAGKVIRCFEKAWEHPDNGGLGLTRGGAIELCMPSVK